MSTVVLSCPEDTLFFLSLPWPLWLVQSFLLPYPWWMLSLRKENRNIPLVTERSIDSCSLDFSQLPVSVPTTTIEKKETFLKWNNSGTNHGHTDTHIKTSLKLCQFSKIIVIALSLETLTFPTTSSWPDLWYQASIFSCGASLKLNRKWLLMPIASVTLWHSWACLSRLVIVAHVLHSGVRLFPHRNLHGTFWYFKSNQ